MARHRNGRRKRPEINPQEIKPDKTDLDESDTFLTFSFRHMDEGLWRNNNKDEKAALASRIFTLSRMSLRNIHLSGRHDMGMEKINNLNISIPSGLDGESAGDPVSFRYGQGMKAMVGVRVDSTFYILCAEHSYGDAYDHGGS